jgi:hypothetical protein
MRLVVLAAGLAATLGSLAATPALALTAQPLPVKPDVAQRLKPADSGQPWNSGGTGNLSFSYSVRGSDGATSYSYGSPRTTLNGDPLPNQSQIRDSSFDTPWAPMPTGRRETTNPLSLSIPRR